MKSLLVAVLFALCMPVFAQTSFEELEFEPDSTLSPYKPAGKNYVFVKSKRGTTGMNKSANVDAILTAEVSEIVLVFSEHNSSAIAEREESNRERWENLLSTYPELFQYSTTYKNVCQCNNNGDSAMFKQKQGFYVYVNGEVPKMEEAKAPTPPPAAPVVESPKAKVDEKKQAEAVAAKKVEEKAAPVKETPVVKDEPVKVSPAAAKEAVKETVKEPEAVAAKTEVDEAEAAPARVKEVRTVKKPAIVKARRSKDTKVCRQPCYGYGDEDLNAFFKDNMTLTKKQKRKGKKWVANVRLQLHYDGTIKKVIVTGTNTDFNAMVEETLKAMNPWNSAVKNGLAIKSEVKFNLKFDKGTKAFKTADMVMNPRLAPKCKCVSDSEIFSD